MMAATEYRKEQYKTIGRSSKYAEIVTMKLIHAMALES